MKATTGRKVASIEAKKLQVIDFKKKIVIEKCWRPLLDEDDTYAYAIVLHRLSRSDKGHKRGQRVKKPIT